MVSFLQRFFNEIQLHGRLTALHVVQCIPSLWFLPKSLKKYISPYWFFRGFLEAINRSCLVSKTHLLAQHLTELVCAVQIARRGEQHFLAWCSTWNKNIRNNLLLSNTSISWNIRKYFHHSLTLKIFSITMCGYSIVRSQILPSLFCSWTWGHREHVDQSPVLLNIFTSSLSVLTRRTERNIVVTFPNRIALVFYCQTTLNAHYIGIFTIYSAKNQDVLKMFCLSFSPIEVETTQTTQKHIEFFSFGLSNFDKSSKLLCTHWGNLQYVSFRRHQTDRSVEWFFLPSLSALCAKSNIRERRCCQMVSLSNG